jgi:transposase
MAEKKEGAEATVRTIRRVTRKKYSAEENVRIVLEGLRGETSIAGLCRREGIPTNLYYRCSKDFLEAGKQRLVGDSERQADTRQVTEMRTELDQLKQLVAELSLKNRVLKKACWARSRRGTSDAAVSSREVRDHPPGRALRLASWAHPGRTGRASQQLLPLVPASTSRMV